MMKPWQPSSWRKKNCAQSVPYPSMSALEEVVHQLSLKDPLVSVEQIHQLSQLLEKASRAEGFILQAGTCAERFELHSTKDQR